MVDSPNAVNGGQAAEQAEKPPKIPPFGSPEYEEAMATQRLMIESASPVREQTETEYDNAPTIGAYTGVQGSTEQVGGLVGVLGGYKVTIDPVRSSTTHMLMVNGALEFWAGRSGDDGEVYNVGAALFKPTYGIHHTGFPSAVFVVAPEFGTASSDKSIRLVLGGQVAAIFPTLFVGGITGWAGYRNVSGEHVGVGGVGLFY